MWGLWFLPLIILIFLVVGAISLILLLTGPPDRAGIKAALIAAPFGCAAMPIAGLLMLAAIGSRTQATDQEIYAEIFGNYIDN